MIRVTVPPPRAVRDPVSHALVPPEGAVVDETNIYWARRLRDGDVVPAPVDPPAPQEA